MMMRKMGMLKVLMLVFLVLRCLWVLATMQPKEVPLIQMLCNRQRKGGLTQKWLGLHRGHVNAH